jgi:hypothetical protein
LVEAAESLTFRHHPTTYTLAWLKRLRARPARHVTVMT